MSYALMWVANGRALAPPCERWRIGVSTSRKSRSTSTLRMACNTAPRRRRVSRAAGSIDEVEIALAHPRLRVDQAAMLVRHRSQALCRHLPAGRSHRQLAASRRDDVAGDRDVIAEVHTAAPVGHRGRVQAADVQHDLEVTAPVANGREADLAVVAGEDDSARDGHRDAGGRVGRQVAVSAWRSRRSCAYG